MLIWTELTQSVLLQSLTITYVMVQHIISYHSWLLGLETAVSFSCLCWGEIPGRLECYQKLMKVLEPHWEHTPGSYGFSHRVNNLFVLYLFSFLSLLGNLNLRWYFCSLEDFCKRAPGKPSLRCLFLLRIEDIWGFHFNTKEPSESPQFYMQNMEISIWILR